MEIYLKSTITNHTQVMNLEPQGSSEYLVGVSVKNAMELQLLKESYPPGSLVLGEINKEEHEFVVLALNGPNQNDGQSMAFDMFLEIQN